MFLLACSARFRAVIVIEDVPEDGKCDTDNGDGQARVADVLFVPLDPEILMGERKKNKKDDEKKKKSHFFLFLTLRTKLPSKRPMEKPLMWPV